MPQPPDIEAKRREVRQAYSAHGFDSPEYNQAFAELHDLNMALMAEQYRRTHGLLPNAPTPYSS